MNKIEIIEKNEKVDLEKNKMRSNFIKNQMDITKKTRKFERQKQMVQADLQEKIKQ